LKTIKNTKKVNIENGSMATTLSQIGNYLKNSVTKNEKKSGFITLIDDRIGKHTTNENSRVRHGESNDNFKMNETLIVGKRETQQSTVLTPQVVMQGWKSAFQLLRVHSRKGETRAVIFLEFVSKGLGEVSFWVTLGANWNHSIQRRVAKDGAGSLMKEGKRGEQRTWGNSRRAKESKRGGDGTSKGQNNSFSVRQTDS